MEELELYRKYRPSSFDEFIGNEITVKSLKKEIENGSHTFLFTGNAGCGKAQPLDSLILTKDKFVKMGDVYVGMKILDGKGNETEIKNVFPQGKRDIYKITFNDRSCIKVADNHINRVFWYNQNKKQKEYFDYTTLDLIEKIKNSKYKLRVDVPVIDCWEEKELPIDPYLLGILISDGSLNNNFSVTISEKDIFEKIEIILNKIDYKLIHINNFDYRIVRKNKINCNQYVTDEDGLRNKIKELKLDCKSIDKYIPEIYLHNSIKNRLELLRGLFDGDGYISKQFGYEFDICSKELSDDFSFLVRSLGIVDTVRESIAKYKDKNGNIKKTSTVYKHYLRIPNDIKIFSSEKHLKRWNKKQTEPIRKIINIEYIGKEECQCIYVSSEDHTYLTDNLTVTHNTTLARIMAKEVGGTQLSIHEINSSENRGIDTAREIMQQMRYSPVDGGKNVYILDECHQWLSPVQNAFLKALEDTPKNTYFFLCTTDPQKLIAPLKTRCSIINVKPLTNKEMTYLLKKIARKEDATISPDVCEKICELSNGSCRQALKYLAKVLYLEEDERMELLNSINSDDNVETIELCRALLDKTITWNKLANILSGMNMSEPEKIRQAVMGYMNACLLKGKCDNNMNAAMQAFSSADTYKNGKFAITVACLDFLSMLD